MDTIHTTEEKCTKVQALIDAVHKINTDSHTHKYDPVFMTAMLESLDELAKEAQECLDALRFEKTRKRVRENDTGTFYGIPKR